MVFATVDSGRVLPLDQRFVADFNGTEGGTLLNDLGAHTLLILRQLLNIETVLGLAQVLHRLFSIW